MDICFGMVLGGKCTILCENRALPKSTIVGVGIYKKIILHHQSQNGRLWEWFAFLKSTPLKLGTVFLYLSIRNIGITTDYWFTFGFELTDDPILPVCFPMSTPILPSIVFFLTKNHTFTPYRLMIL